MGIVRNNINIEGLSSEEELPRKINGQLITFSETAKLRISDSNPEAKSIYEIVIEMDIKSKRTINTDLSKIIVLDGIKKYKILYIEKNELSTANIVYLESPYNTFIELPKNVDNISELNIHILDAYFNLIDNRNIYEHLVYQLDIHHDIKTIKRSETSLLGEDLFDETLIKRLKNVANVLTEAALSRNEYEDEVDNVSICYRNIEDIFM